ncbi:Starch-binding domain-containing protein 1 [Collichthys lucidus]|uniref:Starch-binding domain-containing protein 1 n=1 Tax=Collichthys lucidus TaxID=240159 RepID=A0A4U5V8I7_COLLU|nr:Starch-binding domain-containing protein 1 [Collichthys lucidus]
MKNSNTVAVERRMDLASLFCMIGRHGPAVALAVIAMMSVLAGFVIYRTVRGKRRKATAAADDGDDQSPPGAERDASVIQPSPEEPRRSAESTDINNEGSDMKEDVDLIQSDLVIRHRRAAAAVAAADEKKPSPYSPPNSNIQVPENKNTTSDVTEEMVFVRASHKVAGTYAEEASRGDTYTVAKMVMKDNVDCHKGVTDDAVEDVIEAARGNDSCLKEPEPIDEEKVLKAECQEIEDVSTEKDVFDKKTRQEEENFVLCDLSNPVCFGQTPHMSERGDDDRLQVDKTTLETNSIESNSEEPVIYMEDVPDTCICYSKDEELEKEGEKDEDERAEEECVDNQEPHCGQTDWTKYESFAANEDMFGHEIEDGYHKAMDQFMAQVSASVASFTDDLKIQTDMQAVIEVSEMKEKKAGVCVEKKKRNKEEEEKEEDYEKTEISIMEATMDNNEWITESNYQVLPWLGLSASSFVQDQTKINQLPTEECQYISAGTDNTCIDTTDIPPSTEDIALSLVEENTENNKKVVAVQPMPQNVNVTFRVHYFTQSPYQTVAVTGNQQELGNWKGFIPLERAKDGHWATVVSLPAESNVEWKFVVLDKGEVCRWEECGNRLLDTGYGDDLLVHKWWGLL